MTLRSFVRWIISACWVAVVLGGGRQAQAAAPMCDERGASMIAPPPVLPAVDAKLDVGLPLGCDLTSDGVLALGPRARGQAVVIDKMPDQACVRTVASPIAQPDNELLSGVTAARLSASPGFGRGVFRPPRA